MSNGAGGGDEESPYSEAAQALLLQADGTMPESILKLEPSTVNTVCNDIIETSSAIQWDDIAGALLVTLPWQRRGALALRGCDIRSSPDEIRPECEPLACSETLPGIMGGNLHGADWVSHWVSHCVS